MTAKTLNLYLRQLESKVHEVHRHLLLLNEDLTAQNLMDEFLGRGQKVRKLREVFTMHNEEMATLVGVEYAPMTLLRYQTAFRHTTQYLKEI